jgi:hypothetical protein
MDRTNLRGFLFAGRSLLLLPFYLLLILLG